jgi:hypothetical protein
MQLQASLRVLCRLIGCSMWLVGLWRLGSPTVALVLVLLQPLVRSGPLCMYTPAVQLCRHVLHAPHHGAPVPAPVPFDTACCKCPLDFFKT